MDESGRIKISNGGIGFDELENQSSCKETFRQEMKNRVGYDE